MRGFPWIIALLASWLSLSQVSSFRFDDFTTPYQSNIRSKANYLGECSNSINGDVYVELLMYSCLTVDAMENIITSIKAFSHDSAYTYNLKPFFYVRLPTLCGSSFSCEKVLSFESDRVTCVQTSPLSTSKFASLKQNSFSTKILSICNSDESCQLAKPSGASPIITQNVLDVRTLKPFGDPDNLDPNGITQYFLCGYGGAPVPYLASSSAQEVSCGCMCPPGKVQATTDQGILYCADGPPPLGLCHNLAKETSVIYELTTTQATPSQCLLKGGTVLNKPTVSVNIADNYVNYYDNIGPRISISAVKQTYDYTKSIENIPIQHDKITHINWKEFASNSLYWLDQLDFSEPGLYTVTFDATDYLFMDTCSIKVFVVDNLPPTNSVTCPGTDDKAISVHAYTYDETADVGKKDLINYSEWINNVVNDKCGSNKECDDNKPDYTTQYMGETAKMEIPKSELDACYELKDNDLGNVITECERLRLNPEEEVTENFCKKCCHLEKQTNEKSTTYDSVNDLWNPKCLTGPSCTYDGCISIEVPNNFFTSSVEIAEAYVESTVQALAFLNNTSENYSSTTEIHFMNDCESLDETPECRKSVKIQELFSLVNDFKDEWRHIFGAKGVPDKYITARFKLDGGVWNTYDIDAADYPLYELTRLTHTVDIEVRTPCGIIVTSKHYTIYQHPHQAIELCYALETNGFYQLSQSTGNTIDNGLLCSYPASDFAELSLTFDHTQANLSSSNSNAGSAGFQSIQCSVRHGGDTGHANLSSTEDVLLMGERSDVILEHYAIRLLRDPITAKYTPFTISCEIKYQGYGSYVTSEVCSRSFSAKDCDAPEISIFNKGDKELTTGTCGSNCGGKLLPNSVCGGNIIDYVIDNGVPKTVFHGFNDNDEECCADCGSVRCTDVFEGSIGIKKCLLDSSIPGSFAVLSALPKHLLMNYNTVAFISVGVAVSGIILSVGMIAVRYYRTRNAMNTDDKYSPLI